MGNTRKTEEKGIIFVEDFLSHSEIIQPEIKKNDKTISWDGEIFLLRDKNSVHKCEGRIPIQVKTKTVSKFSKSQAKTNFGISDLENYKKDCGILIFIVQICKNKKKLFYRFLQKVDLANILEQMTELQKTKIIKFAPICPLSSFERKCRDFLINRKKQCSMGIVSVKPEDIQRFSIEGFFPKNEDLYKFLLEKEHYAYIKNSPLSQTFDNVTLIKFDSISKKTNLRVSINGSEYYSGTVFEQQKDKSVIHFGNNITYVLPEKGKEIDSESNTIRFINPKLTHSGKGLLGERINDLTFFIKVLNGNTVKINDKDFFTIPEQYQDKQKIEQMKTNLSYYQNIAKLLEVYDVPTKDLDMHSIESEDAKKNLSLLINHVVLGNTLKMDSKQTPYMQNIKIGNLNLLSYFLPTNNPSEYSIGNFCHLDNFGISDNENEEKTVPVSPYIFLTKDSIINCNNIRPSKIVPSILCYEKEEPYKEKVNALSLELLKAFDQTAKDEFLTCAGKINDWLLEDEDLDSETTNIYLINKFQIIRRNRCLLPQEVLDIDKIDTCNNQIICCKHILLERFGKFKDSFNTLNEKEKKTYKTFPIYTLYKNLKAKKEATI